MVSHSSYPGSQLPRGCCNLTEIRHIFEGGRLSWCRSEQPTACEGNFTIPKVARLKDMFDGGQSGQEGLAGCELARGHKL